MVTMGEIGMEKDDIRISERTRKDGWSNLFTGLGTSADKRVGTVNVSGGITSDLELENIYASDGLAAKIVDLVAEDMVRQGWKYVVEGESEEVPKYAIMYEKMAEQIKLHERVASALKWARLYGGSLILLGAYDGEELGTKLVPRKIRNFESLKVVPRTQVEFSMVKWQNDETKPRFGEIEYYPVKFNFAGAEKTINVHWSRVIEVRGIEVPKFGGANIPREYRYWGIPVLQRVKERVADLAGSFGSLSSLMQEISVGKYKFQNLADILSMDNGNQAVQKRIQAMDLMKSTFHSVFMDSEDDFVRDTLSFAGVSDVIYQFFTLICASTGYPMTRLFGTSPGGLNSTGDSDTYAYYDNVAAEQRLKLKPILNRIVGVYAEAKNIPEAEIEFNPLEQMTEKERAELEEKEANSGKMKAETYQQYIDMGILEPYMVEEMEFGDSLKEMREKNEVLPDVGGEGEEE